MYQHVIEHLRTVYLQVLEHQNFQPLLSNVDEEVSWGWGSQAPVPWYGMKRGRAGVAEFFTNVHEHLQFTAFQMLDFVADRDLLYNAVRYQALVKKTGKVLSMDGLIQWKLREGKVVVHRLFEDTAAAAAAWQP
jgi:ketosteroid isomerase-like protein